MSNYTSTAAAPDIAERLRAARFAVVLTHAKPDGDAAGSVLAAVRILERLGAEAEGWFVGPFPAWLPALAAESVIRKFGDQPAVIDPSWPEPDLIVIVDTGSHQQLDQFRHWLAPRAARCVIIDHHLHGNAEIAPLRLIDTRAASCTQVLASVADAALGVSPTDPLPIGIAEPLYFGLATDTGWFRFSNVTADTLRLGARLLECGVDAPRLYEWSEQQQAPARPRLLGVALAGLEWYAQNTIAVMTLTQAQIAGVGGQGEDVGGFADPALAVRGVRVVVTLTEMSKPGDAKPLTKASLRSKPGERAVDVAAVCATLGGGGHARAAGVKLNMPLAEARAAVLRALGVHA